MTPTTIKTIIASEVIVPSRPDSLNSVDVQDKDQAFAKKFLTGQSWTDFAIQPKWILQVILQNGITGIGETYRSASSEALKKAIDDLTGKDILSLNWKRLPISDQRIYEAFETAILDAAGQLMRVPIYQLLGGAYREKVECNGWTGRRNPEDAAAKAYEAMQEGHQVFKFKCSDEDPVRLWTKAIREKCGTGIRIILDPNQRWKDVATTLKLMEGVDKEIMYGLEDPILHEDVEGFAFLRKTLDIPIFRHISLPYTQDIRDMIQCIKHESADGYNFNGSAYNSILLAEMAHLEQKACWRGSEVDLGISETMGLHIAAASINCTIPSDIFGELVRVNDLILHPIEFERGAAIVPIGPGLGATLDTTALETYKTGNIIHQIQS